MAREKEGYRDALERIRSQAALSIYCTRCDAKRTYYARPGEDYAAARRNALATWNERMNYD